MNEILFELFLPANSLSMTDSSKTTCGFGRITTWITSSFCVSASFLGTALAVVVTQAEEEVLCIFSFFPFSLLFQA